MRAALIVLSIPVLGALTFAGAVAWWPYPAGIDRAPASATFIDDRNGVPLAALVAADGQWRIPLTEAQISPHLLNAIVAVEDSRFFSHAGVDWRSALMAAWEDVRSLRIRRGGSTLTMQVQRLRDPRPRTFFNKFEQAVRAQQIEKTTAKADIRVEYLNRAPFGGNLVGAGAASWRYFAKPCAQLSLAEAALLAGLPQSPNRLRPDRYPQRAVARRNHVLGRMLALGMIDQLQHDQACAEPISAIWRPLPQERPASAPAADGALPALAGLAGGTMLKSTIDAAVQKQAADAALDHLTRLESSGVSAAAVVVLDTPSAECLAAVSLSRGHEHLDLTRRPRSTGSTLKSLIYASAFDCGAATPATVLDDSPTAWAGYEPADYDHKFRGHITAAEALAESRNIPAMVVLAKVGVEPTVGLMEAAGLKTLGRSPGRYGLSLAIGGAEASPMEVAQAYAMLARGGRARDIRLVCTSRDSRQQIQFLLPVPRGRVRVGDSSVIVEEQPPPLPSPGVPGEGAGNANAIAVSEDQTNRSLLSSEACWQTLAALSGIERSVAVCPAAARLHVAWKTGTSNGHRDAWCAAVTRHRTVVVWLGNAGGQASSALVGAEAAAPLALRLIASLDTGPPEPWPVVIARKSEGESRQGKASASLTMISPASNQQFVLDPDSPRERQRVLLKASLRFSSPTSESRTLWWFVDGQPVGVAEAGMQLWWEPTRGSHEVRVIDALGHAAAVQVGVR